MANSAGVISLEIRSAARIKTVPVVAASADAPIRKFDDGIEYGALVAVLVLLCRVRGRSIFVTIAPLPLSLMNWDTTISPSGAGDAGVRSVTCAAPAEFSQTERQVAVPV